MKTSTRALQRFRKKRQAKIYWDDHIVAAMIANLKHNIALDKQKYGLV